MDDSVWKEIGAGVGAALAALASKGGFDWWRRRGSQDLVVQKLDSLDKSLASLQGSIADLSGEVCEARSQMRTLTDELGGARRDVAVLIGKVGGS